MMKYFKNEKGVTLVEVMIAFVILLLVFIGLTQSALLSIDSNLRNILRDEAVAIAAGRMEDARNMLFNNLASDTALNPVSLTACGNPPVSNAGPYPRRIDRNFRNIANFPFATQMTVTPLDGASIPAANTAQITVLVRWEYKNECYSHSVSTLRRR